jgi:hypothetical protein
MALMEGLKRISDTVWEIPVSYKEGMRVPARIYGTEKLIQELDDAVYDQVTNVATLPGVTKYALCMPDGTLWLWVSHWWRCGDGCRGRGCNLPWWHRFRYQLWNALNGH